MQKKHVKELRPADVIGEDIFHNNSLIVKKGTMLTERLINHLKQRQLTHVHVIAAFEKEKQPDNYLYNQTDKSMLLSVPDRSEIEQEFLESLSHVGFEYRYGKILHEEEDVLFLRNLFIEIYHTYPFMETLSALKTWDFYSFIHSFDVFVLGTLLAKRCHVKNLPVVAAGYLFHDIGKVKVSQEILHKQTKLTLAEFQVIKSHTWEGENLLKTMGCPELAVFAKSHHERINGSGYPDGLTEKDLSLEIKILNIVDVYSALTLKRAYKEEAPASEAVKTLLRDHEKYDSDLLFTFIEALMIFPDESTVLLSNNKQAKITQVSRFNPTVPYITTVDRQEPFELPINFSVTISKIIGYQIKSKEEKFKDFFTQVTEGQYLESFELFQELADGMQLEDIYINIIQKLVDQIEDRFAEEMLSSIEYKLGYGVIIRIMDELEKEISQHTTYQSKALILLTDKNINIVHAKLFSGLLHMEKALPLLLTSPSSEEEVNAFAAKKNIDHIFLLDYPEEDWNKLRSSQQNKKLTLTLVSQPKLDNLLMEMKQKQKKATQILWETETL